MKNKNSTNIIKVGIIGISGYSGLEAFEILLKHPHVRVTYIGANNTEGKIATIWPHLKGKSQLICKKLDLNEAAAKCDVLFLAVPHTTSMQLTPKLLKKGKTVIDLSGDYRLNNAQDYKKWYGQKHLDKINLKKAIYGLPELYREDIKKAQFVSNPGCYPTAALLGLLPLASLYGNIIDSITIDAKSGVTGAGRKAHIQYSFAELSQNFKAYKPLIHQHVPEINLYLSKVASQLPEIDFVPHLLPINRGILETIYIRLKKPLEEKNLNRIYERFYKTEPFVRILEKDALPELKNVIHSNYCDIGLTTRQDKKLIVVTSAIDNLVKGAAGQAVQNMNIIYGFKETEGLL